MFGMKLIYDQTGQMQDIQKIFLIILHKQYHQNLKNLSYIVKHKFKREVLYSNFNINYE